jgi:hypothetical protein
MTYPLLVVPPYLTITSKSLSIIYIHVLMPWIAEKFSWVLDHRSCQRRPPSLQLVDGYTWGMCSASIVRQFFDFFPKGLGQQDRFLKKGRNGSSLHDQRHRSLLCRPLQMDGRKNPSSVSYKDQRKCTTLQNAIEMETLQIMIMTMTTTESLSLFFTTCLGRSKRANAGSLREEVGLENQP